MGRTLGALIVITLCVPAAPAAEADDLLSRGAKLLHRAITGDDSALVPAAIALTRASSLFQKDGDDEGARKANALLYWCKKRMTLADIEAFNKGADSASTRKLHDISAPVAPSQADVYYRRAEECARENPDDHLLVAVRFFEVADRFAQTPVGVKAMRRSLDAMQKVRVRSNVAVPPSNSEAKRTPTPMSIRTLVGAWRSFAKGVKCHKGGKEFVMEVPEQLDGRYYLEVRKGRLNISIDGDVTLYAFTDHAVKRLREMGFRPAPGVQVVWRGAFGKRRTSQVYMKECRRGDAVVEEESWIMLIASLDAMQEAQVKPAATTPPSNEVGPASHPEVAAIKERHTASVEKARAAYLKKLKSAFDRAKRTGRLDAVNLIDAEMRAVKESDTVATASEFDSSSLRYAQKAYRDARYRALAAYVKDLDRLVSTETRKGNLEKARYFQGLSNKAKRQLPPMTIQKVEGDWRPFAKGVKCYRGAQEFVVEVPEQLDGKYYLEVGKGRLNIRMNGIVTLYAFGVHAMKGLQRMGFRPAPGLRVVTGGMGRKPKVYPVYMKRCRRGDAVVERKFWLMLIVD